MKKTYTDEKIVEVIKDFVNSGDKAETVARRHEVSVWNVVYWSKRAGFVVPKRHRNWGLISQMVKGSTNESN